MASWVTPKFVVKPTPEEEQRKAFSERLTAARAKMEELERAKREQAIAAATGDERARRAFCELEASAAQERTEIDILARAVETLDQQKADAECQIQEERLAKAAEHRKAFLDAEEAEQRRQIERMIDRFERTGQRNQADIYRNELPRLRQRLEAQFPERT